jgi:hypothetical protein
VEIFFVVIVVLCLLATEVRLHLAWQHRDALSERIDALSVALRRERAERLASNR